MQIRKGKQRRPRRVLIYGENGVGKSSFAAKFPKPIFLNFEDGVGDLDVDSTPIITSLPDLMNCVIDIYNSHHEYQSVVVDTADWLERLVMRDVAQKAGKETIEQIGFGKGMETVAYKWRELLQGFTSLWEQGRHIVFVAHANIKKFKNPEGDAYDYWCPALDEKGSGLIPEWCDEVLFAKSRIHTIQREEGPAKAVRAVAIGGKERYMVTNESAASVAKNRLGLPEEMPLDFAAFAKYLGDIPLIQPKPSDSPPTQAA